MVRRVLRVLRRPLVLLSLGPALLVVLLLPSLVLAVTTGSHRTASIAAVPRHRVAIVLGAGIYGPGQLSPMLADRVAAGAHLYRTGIVRKLLMTGDNSRTDYDEVTAMGDEAVRLGVDPRDIALDHAGFSTYDSCVRARKVFGLRDAVLVTQRFHLARAVYTCRSVGVAVDGLGLPDWSRYRRHMPGPQTREVVAAWKAVLDVELLHPDPHFLGPPVEL